MFISWGLAMIGNPPIKTHPALPWWGAVGMVFDSFCQYFFKGQVVPAAMASISPPSSATTQPPTHSPTKGLSKTIKINCKSPKPAKHH